LFHDRKTRDPNQHGTFRRRDRAFAGDPRDGLRRAVIFPRSIDRHPHRKGRNNSLRAEPGGSRQSVRDRRR